MLPTITGLIDRRILLNFRADPDEVQRLLPRGMQARVVNDFALVGVCLIRFKQLRPAGFPSCMGMTSENAAFRISVSWSTDHHEKTGVYVLQRVTNSRFVAACGGRTFPGVHQLADFSCTESETDVSIEIAIPEQPPVRLAGTTTEHWTSEVFESHQQASEFFRLDKIGYSPTRSNCACEGLELECLEWSTSALATSVNEVAYLTQNIPSCVFDHALIMHNIHHSWHSVPKFHKQAG